MKRRREVVMVVEKKRGCASQLMGLGGKMMVLGLLITVVFACLGGCLGQLV